MNSILQRSIAVFVLFLIPTLAEAAKLNVVAGQDRPELALLVVGEVQGGLGTSFRTDVMLINNRSVDQPVVVRWLPRDQNGAAIPAVPLTLRANAFFPLRDFVHSIGQTGIGSVIVTAVTADGSFDVNGKLDGFARVYTETTCGNTTGTVSQAQQSVITSQFAGAERGTILGLRQDAGFRTNVGVVNFDRNAAHTFDIVISGQGVGGSMTITVQPSSLTQLPIPAGTYGDLLISVRGRSDAAAWHAYGSSVDNQTGDGWIALAGN